MGSIQRNFAANDFWFLCMYLNYSRNANPNGIIQIHAYSLSLKELENEE